MPSFTQLLTLPLSVSQVAICPRRDIVALVTASGALAVYRFSVADRTQERLCPPPEAIPVANSPVTALCWSTDGTALAVGHADGAIFLWDVESGLSHPAAIDGPALFPSAPGAP